MKKILITGASGMLGAALVKSWNKKYKVFATASSNYHGNSAKKFKIFNLKAENYGSLARWINPDIIIHCAALTSHEYCQNNPKEAMLVNGSSVKKLLEAFPKSKLIFISTDAVFPLGTHLAKEKTKTGAVTVYGKSKELGEKFILNSKNDGCIVRTTIVGENINPNKQGFVEWIVNSLKENMKITLYEDVIFTPITIWHLEKELDWIINNKSPNILHIAGTEITSKHDFGYNLCKELSLDLDLITKGKLSQNTKIKKSHDQTLDSSFYRSISKHRLPNLKETIKILVKNFK